MATELATAYISIVPSARGFRGALEKDLGGAGQSAAATTETAFSRAASRAGGAFKTSMKVAAVAGGAAFGAAILGAKSAIDAASDYEESVSKIDAVFGAQSSSITKWADTASTAFGQSKAQALEAAGGYGNLLTSFGLNDKAAAGMSTSLVELASDLASFNNTSPDEALEALRSGLTGEMEPLKRYGVALDDASLKAKALALGIADGKSVLTPAQKAQASYALIMERTTNAQGDFARTSGGLANQQRIFAARIEDLKIKVGQALLPALNKLLPVFGRLMDAAGPLIDRMLPRLRAGFATISDWWARNGPAITAKVKEVFGKIVEVVSTVVAMVQERWPQIQQIIGNVINTVSTVISGAVSVITTLWDNFGNNILSFVERTWPRIQQVIEGALGIIRGIINTITSLIKGDWSGVWEGIKGVVAGVWEAIQGVVGGALEGLRAVVGIALETLGSVFKGAWEGIRNTATSVFGEVVDFIKGFPQTLIDTVTGLASKLGEVGIGLIKGIFSAIGETSKIAVDFAKDMVNGIIDFINDRIIKGINDALEIRVEVWGRGVDINPQDIPPIPKFHTGGVVPGRPGEEVLAVLQAGEEVLTAEQRRRRDAGSNTTGAVVNQYFAAADPVSVARVAAWELHR